MKILVTGAQGFVGKNLVANLKNIQSGKDRTRPHLQIDAIYEYGRQSTQTQLHEYCADCDFVFHLAGANRPQEAGQWWIDNVMLVSTLLETLRGERNPCPVMLASSIQATLAGRYGRSEYGKSKLAGEERLFSYAKDTGADVLVYRFPNVFGKWCRPGYNSVVATFCSNIANDLPVTVNDPHTQLELLYIDDLVAGMLDALEGTVHRCEFEGTETVLSECGRYCTVPAAYKATLGEIVALLLRFHDQPQHLIVPAMPADSFEKKLYATYLSYLPKEKIRYPLSMKTDARGSFTELFKSESGGQVSVNISKPGITKGQHWHNSKGEIFVVVSGHGLIQQRKIGTEEVLEFEVSGHPMQAVHMLPGYTHNIINLSHTEDLVTVMWANEWFDPQHPDTFGEEVKGDHGGHISK